MSNTSDKIKEIKAQFRLFMNGAVSHSMRKKGFEDYKLNFGIELPRIKEIAAQFEPNVAVAESLWLENIRECKILATMLYPKEEFDVDTANLWVKQTPNIEIAQMLSMNLLQHLEFVPSLTFSWIASDNDLVQTIGFITISRLVPAKIRLEGRAADEFTNQLIAAGQSADYQLRHAAVLAATSFMEQGPEFKNTIMALIEPLEVSENQYAKTFYQVVSEEASFL